MLDKLLVTDVIVDLSRMVYGFTTGDEDIALICYEKPSDFCHRHLVAEWFRNHGHNCEEWTKLKV